MRQWSLFRNSLLVLCVASVLPPPAASSGPAIPPIVFVSRNPLPGVDPGEVPGIGPLWRTAVTGGRLLLRSPGGAIVTLAGPDRLFDVADPCVSWDGRRVVFAGVGSPDSSWRIYEVGVNGKGFRGITHTDRRISLSQFGTAAGLFLRYDDFDPCYLPDGRIVFASTRYPALASLDGVLTSNLFVVASDGSDLHRITTERNGAEEPSVDPLTGRLAYARWWINVDRPSNSTRDGLSRDGASALTGDTGNLWQVVTIRPDGDELRLFGGFARTRAGVHAYKPVVMSDGRLLTTFTGNLSPASGLGGTAIRLFQSGPCVPRPVTGAMDGSAPFALEAAELDPQTIVCSFSRDGSEYGIYRCRLDGGGLHRLVDFPGTLEMDPQPVRNRRTPPVLEDALRHPPLPLPPTEDPQTHTQDDFFRFDCMNIFTNAGVDVPIPDAPRITRNARIRFFMNTQRQNSQTPDPSILLKEVAVMYHGGVHEHDVPAEVSLFEQIVDSSGRVLETTDGRFAHVAGFNFERQGAGTKCIGCHAGHSMMEVPVNGSAAQWFNLAPSASVTASSVYTPQRGTAFDPGRLTDRQALTGGDSVVWIAAEKLGAAVRLTWAIPVELRELVLYGVPRGLRKSSLSVADCRITLMARGERIRTLPATGVILERGTRIPLLPTVIDELEVVVGKSRGKFDGRSITGLAEIEAIGRIPLPGAEWGAER